MRGFVNRQVAIIEMLTCLAECFCMGVFDLCTPQRDTGPFVL